MKIRCKKCGSTKVFTDTKGNQTGIYCSDCGKWIKWATKDEIRLIEHNSTSDAKLTVDAIAGLQAKNIMLAEEKTELKIKLEKIRQIVDEWNNDASNSFGGMCKINGILKE